jgi:DNA-binding XRE family transcriptional regulator
VRIEVRAVGLRTMRHKRGLTQRRLGNDLGLSHYIPAIEEGARRAGPGLQDRFVDYFGCRFEDLFEAVPVNTETTEVRVLHPSSDEALRPDQV